jgi:ubiquinone biosynthesis protein UbiJ
MGVEIDPALRTAVLAALEGAVNRALALDPATRRKLAGLRGQVYALHCTAPEVDIFLQLEQDGVRLMGVYDGTVAASVTGPLSDLAAVATSDDPAATLINGPLEIGGDSADLIRLQQVIGELDLDWEAPLVEALGDVPGHQLAELLRGAGSWGRRAGASLARQLGEFIHEEARLTPPRLELEDFYGDVAALQERVERLESRTRRLQRRLERLQSQR